MTLMSPYERDLADTHEDPDSPLSGEPSDAPEPQLAVGGAVGASAGAAAAKASEIAALAAFVGTWRLDAAQCVYQDGEPPRSSTQRIDVRDGRVIFHVESVLADGWDVSYVLSRIPDGVERRHADPDVADTLRTRLEGRTLETISRRGSLITRHTIRMLSEDGVTLTVVQLGFTRFGNPFRNRSIYRRA